jgi:hypothetical protein
VRKVKPLGAALAFFDRRRNFSMKLIFGIFIVLHSLVHLLYFGQSARYFELKSGMLWPDGSWAFSRLLTNEATRNLASVALITAAIGLIAGAIGMLVGQVWWRPLIMGATAFSSVVFLLLWNGRTQNLDAQGLVGILIDIAILMIMLVLRWPSTE